jgi:hypothetical protein
MLRGGIVKVLVAVWSVGLMRWAIARARRLVVAS